MRTRKSKYAIKELPFAWYEVDALEAWLDEQSQQGLQMVDFLGFNFGYRRAVFMESTAAPTRYRVHIKPQNGYYTQREEYKATMQELGWAYVGQLNYRTDIYRAARPDAVEINTDEDALRDSIQSANRLGLICSILLLLLIPVMLFNGLRFLRSYDGFYDMLLDGTTLITVSAVLLAAFWLVLGVFGILRSMALRRRYLLDRSYRPTPEIRKRKHVRAVLASLICLSVLPLVVLYLAESAIPVDVPFPECPVALLESLSPEEAAQLDYDPESINAPRAFSGKSLLYSYATYRQDGPTIWLEGAYAGTGYHAFSYWVTIKDIRTESLVEKYYAEKLAAHDWQVLQINGWDQAVYRRYFTDLRQEFRSNRLPETPGMLQQELLLRLGNRVVMVGYTGETDMSPRLNALYGLRTADVSA